MISTFLYGLSAGLLLALLIQECGMYFAEARYKKIKDKCLQRNKDKRRQRNEEDKLGK